jgi:hypothetical protein
VPTISDCLITQGHLNMPGSLTNLLRPGFRLRFDFKSIRGLIMSEDGGLEEFDEFFLSRAISSLSMAFSA